jgi:hypothetical protein
VCCSYFLKKQSCKAALDRFLRKDPEEGTVTIITDSSMPVTSLEDLSMGQDVTVKDSNVYNPDPA